MEATRLTQYFHPVARSSEVGERLTTRRLMNEDVVLYRNAEGRAVAFKALCIHRGSRLSLGEVTPEGNLRCAYHGWEYALDGAAAHLRQVLGGNGETTIVTMTAAPLGPKLSRVYMWNNHNLDPEHDGTMLRFARQVMEEDRTIVESQRPELIPLDLRDEMHLKVPDAFSIVYRRLLDEFGPDESFLHA